MDHQRVNYRIWHFSYCDCI